MFRFCAGDFYKNFLAGTLSACTATCCIQPMDMIKVRIQLRSESGGSTSPFSVAREIYGAGGVKEFYKGLDAAIMRQLVYGTLRLGIYFNLIEYFKKQNGSETTTFMQKTQSSLFAGCFGSFVGNPADLALVRLQADSSMPPEERRNYKGVFDAIQRIVAEEGVPALWKGAVPTMTRAVSLNIAMMVSYDTAREQLEALLGKENKYSVQFSASMVSACCTAFFSLPFDNMKTKIQKQKALPDGSLPYKNLADCFSKSLAKEGPTGFWAGLPTYYFRVGPHAIITLIAAEQYRRLLGIGK